MEGAAEDIVADDAVVSRPIPPHPLMSSPTRDPSRASRASPTRPPQTLEIFAHPPTPNPDPHPQTVQGTALETRGEVTATCYDTSGTRMATCTTQGAIHVWDRVDGPDGAPGTWRQTAAWAAHRSACRAVAFAGAEFGRCLASSSDDGTICLWRESVRAPGAAAAAAATAAAEDGSSEWERCAQLRDSSKPVTRLAFAPADHGLQLAAAGDDGAVRFYSPADQLALHQWELCNESEALRPGAACSGVAWRVPNAAVVTDADRFDGPEGIHAGISPPTLAVALRWPDGANDARVLCYDEAGMRWRVSGRVYEGPAEVNALAWSPVTRAGEPETIALALGADVGLFRVDGRALMDDGSSGAGVESPRAALDATLHHPAKVVGLDWNSVGNTLATSAEDGRVRLWSANALDGTWETQAQLVGE
jgi:WD40 repeat protein